MICAHNILRLDLVPYDPSFLFTLYLQKAKSDSILAGMSKDTFAFSSASLRSFRLEQELQDWEDARRTLAQRRALTRTPLAPVPRPPRQQHSLRTTSHTLGPYRCRDPAVLNTFLSGDMTRVYAVLKDPTMVNALMETVQEEMTWAPEMGGDSDAT